MLENFQLAAIVGKSDEVRALRIPMSQSLQRDLAASWAGQFEAFAGGVQGVAFNAGYNPEEHECFVIPDYELPAWLVGMTSVQAAALDAIASDADALAGVRGIAGFARDAHGAELVMFQNFSRSHVIAPGSFLLLKRGTYETTEHPGLRLEDKLSAVLLPQEGKLLFRNFRSVNTFLPLAEFFEEASEQQIREVLCHERLAAISVDALAVDANQWFRKRFAMLSASGVLDAYTPKQIQNRATGYGLTIAIRQGKIVFPDEKVAAKKLLQFLNEELFKGAITEALYETNSKRVAD